MKIGVLSDTHNYLPKKAIHYLEGCDEIWHGGDIGSINVLEKLEQICLTRAVWGNIDNEIIRRETEEYLIFKIKNFKILIIHIAGKINSYNRKTRDLILENKPNLLVCGHSHILKIARDKKYNLIYFIFVSLIDTSSFRYKFDLLIKQIYSFLIKLFFLKKSFFKFSS